MKTPLSRLPRVVRGTGRVARAVVAAVWVSALLPPVCAGEDLSAVAGDLSLIALSGEPITLGEALGDSLPDGGAVLLFWSMYQPDSRRALRAIDILRAEVGERGVMARFVAIEIPEYREAPEQVADFLERASIGIPVYVDPGGRAMAGLARFLGLDGVSAPACLLFSGAGDLVRRVDGWQDRYSGELKRALTQRRHGGGAP